MNATKTIVTATAMLFATQAFAAELIDVDAYQQDVFNIECMSCITEPGFDRQEYDQTLYITSVDLGVEALKHNQLEINNELTAAQADLLVQQAKYEELLAIGEQAYDETHARIDAEVDAGNQRLEALERLATLTTNELGQSAQIQSNTQRIGKLESEVDDLRRDAAGWASMAAAIDSGYLGSMERFAISGNVASVGSGTGAAINAVARINGGLTFNASVATSSAGDVGGMVGARFGW